MVQRKRKLLPFMLLVVLTGFAACQNQAFTSLTPTQYQSKAKKEAGVLVDVRTPEEFASGHVANALNSDWRGGQFVQEIQHWDKNKTYYLYCASGNRSGQAMNLMKEKGFKKVYNLGGFKDLKTAGLPVKEKN